MQFMFALILCFASSVALAASQDYEYLTEMYKIYKKYSDNARNEDYKGALNICGDKGNYYCSARLADIYYDEKEYQLSFDYYTKCSGKCDGWCDFRLGYLYKNGLGILQNTQNGINHYKKSAKSGVPEAAYNISVYYEDKMCAVDRFSEEGQRKFNDYAIRRYAWDKVALAMGLQEYQAPDGTKKPASQLLNNQMYILESYGLMASADKLAIEICSGIKACKQ